MRKKRFQKACGFVLASALVVSALAWSNVNAARKIDTTKTDCAIEVDVLETGAKELKTMSIDVNFYKVADVSEWGEYTAVDALGSDTLTNKLDFADLNEENAPLGKDTEKKEKAASYWMEKAALAKAAVEEANLAPIDSCQVNGGVGAVTGLPVGLYLVDAQPAESDSYAYNFVPYLVSLPNNYYDPMDEWNYCPEVGLKAEKVDRYGDLEITKDLKSYNATYGGATFVFSIEGTKVDPDTEEETVVYSDVVSMTFKNPGKDKITIKGIPAGAEVTVREVYSGASYSVAGGSEITVSISAEKTAQADFTNDYDGRLNGGYGVVNTFTYDDGTDKWIWEATEDSTP